MFDDLQNKPTNASGQIHKRPFAEGAHPSSQFHNFSRAGRTFHLDTRLKAILDPFLADGFSTGALCSYFSALSLINNDPKSIHDQSSRREIDQNYGPLEHAQSVVASHFSFAEMREIVDNVFSSGSNLARFMKVRPQLIREIGAKTVTAIERLLHLDSAGLNEGDDYSFAGKDTRQSEACHVYCAEALGSGHSRMEGILKRIDESDEWRTGTTTAVFPLVCKDRTGRLEAELLPFIISRIPGEKTVCFDLTLNAVAIFSDDTHPNFASLHREFRDALGRCLRANPDLAD